MISVRSVWEKLRRKRQIEKIEQISFLNKIIPIIPISFIEQRIERMRIMASFEATPLLLYSLANKKISAEPQYSKDSIISPMRFCV